MEETDECSVPSKLIAGLINLIIEQKLKEREFDCRCSSWE